MTSPDSGNGCGTPLMFLLTLVMGMFGGLFWVAPGTSITSGGGVEIDLPQITMSLVLVNATADAQTMERSQEIIDQRLQTLSEQESIDAFSVQLDEMNRLVIELDGYTADETAFMNTLTQRGSVEFVSLTPPTEIPQALVGTSIRTTGNPNADSTDSNVYPTLINYQDIESASAQVDSFDNRIIEINLTASGARTLGEWSAANIGAPLAIVVDNMVLSVPIIQTRVETPVILSGNFTEAEAYTLAAQINSQPLPVELEVESMSANAP